MKKRFLTTIVAVILLLALSISNTIAQENNSKSQWLEKISLTPQLGLLHSWGDFREDGIFPGLFDPDQNKLGVGLLLNYNLSKVISISGGVLSGELEGRQESIKTTGAANEPRDLGVGIYFNTNLLEVTLPRIDVNLTRLIFQDKVKLFEKLSVNLMASHGLVYYETKIYSIQEDVPLIYGRRRGRTGKTTEAVTSGGLGLKYRLNDKFDIGIESSVRNVWNDKLDAWVTEGSANDKYSFTAIGVTYHLKARKKKIEEFMEEEPSYLAEEGVDMIKDEGPKTVIEEGSPLVDSTEIIDLPNADKETVFGVYTYKKLPAINQAIVVLDENGLPIDTIYTDENGKFQYTKLDPDANISFTPLNAEDIDLDEIALEVTNGKTKETVFGVYNYEKLPAINQAIVVLDENGLPIDTIYTDENGKFQYTKLDPDANISFAPLNAEDIDLEEVAIETNSQKTKDTQQMVYNTKRGYFANVEDVRMKIDTSNIDPELTFKEIDLKDETLFGYYQYNKLPMDNKALVVMDQDGNPIDTLYTDDDGYFEYPTKMIGKQITIVPLGLDTKELKNVELYLTDQNKKNPKRMILDPMKSSFSLRQLASTPPKPVGTTTAKDGVSIYEGGGNFIVVAAFRGLEGSKRKVNELLKKGIQPIVTRNRIDTWYWIAINRYDNKEEALQKMREARTNGYEKAWVGVK